MRNQSHGPQVAIPSVAGVLDGNLHLTDDLVRAEVAGLVATLAARARAASEEKIAA